MCRDNLDISPLTFKSLEKVAREHTPATDPAKRAQRGNDSFFASLSQAMNLGRQGEASGISAKVDALAGKIDALSTKVERSEVRHLRSESWMTKMEPTIEALVKATFPDGGKGPSAGGGGAPAGLGNGLARAGNSVENDDTSDFHDPSGENDDP